MFEYGQLEKETVTESKDMDVAVFPPWEHYGSITYFILYKSFQYLLSHF